MGSSTTRPGPNPTLTPAQLDALGLGDGPSGPLTVTLQVTDGTDLRDRHRRAHGHQHTADCAVRDRAARRSSARTCPATLTFGADSPAASDDAAGFTYSIGWGDGTPVQSAAAGTTVDVEHTWTTDGTFTIGVTATDKDGGTSTPVTATVGALPPVIAGAGGPYTVEEGQLHCPGCNRHRRGTDRDVHVGRRRRWAVQRRDRDRTRHSRPRNSTRLPSPTDPRDP